MDTGIQVARPHARGRLHRLCWSTRARRVVTVLVAAVTLLVLVVVGTVLALDRSLTRVDVEGLRGGSGTTSTTEDDPSAEGSGADAADVQVEHHPDAVTVLLLGSDSRDVLTEQERVELGTGYAYGERTEVVSLVRLDPDDDELRMVQIPRDSIVTRCDGSRGRINAAYGIGESNGVGGMTCVVQTVSDWSGIDIDHVVKVDFRGFVDIVDRIGGIELYLDQPLHDQDANLDVGAGCQTLDGAQALAFVRARSIDDDFGRMGRQQRLLVELRDEIAEQGVLSSPVRTVRLAEAVASAVEVDSSLTLNRIRQLALAHRGTIQGELDGRTVPGTRAPDTEAWLLEPDEEAADRLFTWLLEGEAEGAADDEPDVSNGDQTAPDGDQTAPDGDTTSPTDDRVATTPQRCG